MITAVLGLRRRHRIGWTLALNALATGFAETLWGFWLDARLTGVMPALMNRRRLLTSVASVIAAGALFWIRRLYQ